MPEKKEKKRNIKQEVALLRDDLGVLKKRLDLLFKTCDEGLVKLYTNEKEPDRLLDRSLEQVARLKVSARTMIQSFLADPEA
jgi:hypothetical protein